MKNVSERRDYRATLNLPKTDFPMRADLAKREPARVAWWRDEGVYERRLAKNRENNPWILHDGPPYANGDLHMGHFLNRVLKDAFVKIHLLDGEWADFVPGWDMHGLPIEIETLRHLGLDFHKIEPLELRAQCRERAIYWLDRQREQIVRMGVLGHYDRPYRTVDPSFEATIIETLADLAESEQLYKGLRATLWCVYDETALAEAEIEYHDRTSPSIYVRFTANDAQRADLLARFGVEMSGDLSADPLSIVIWTTTPWTLPANVAIAIKPEATYGLYRVGRELVVVADALAAGAIARIGHHALESERIAGVAGSELVGSAVRHPFAERDSLVVGADYVELDTGTGAVHTAPGHGVDDFDTSVRYGLDVLNPVNAAGRYTAAAGVYAGQFVFDANQTIINDLRASGALVSAETYGHSYPHCWRCKNPVIFRATAQWFIALDVNRLRARIIEKLPQVRWSPPWGEGRMTQMIENHPEWCLSRQRTWGTPIPAVVCTNCSTSILDPDIARTVAGRFREEGAGIWWTEPVESFLPPNFDCPSCRGMTFVKEMNIVDIWFESGVTHRAVLGHDGLPWPADAYLEGADQYRGWFRSSLVTGVATKGAAPYKTVVSTGWVVDADGRAMHKSAGNYIAASDAMERWGADVLRLWVASVEYTADVRLGDKLLDNVSNVYRNLRNRLRFLLSNLYDLEADAIMPRPAMEPIDRVALATLDALAAEVVAHYRAFRLHDAYLALLAFDNDLSAYYLDPLKDPLYSYARDAKRRRSAQSALLEIFRTLAVLLAPILSFTAEEAWQHLPDALKGDAKSIFDVTFPPIVARDADALSLWNEIKELRAQVAASDTVRDFEAAANVAVIESQIDAVRALGDNLREALIVSAVVDLTPTIAASSTVSLVPAPGGKCERCRKTLPLGEDPAHPTLCASCAAIVHAIERAA